MTHRRTTAVAVLAAVVLLLVGCGTVPAAAPSASAPPPPPPKPVVDVPVAAATPTPVRPAVAPVRVSIAAAGIDVPVVPVGVEPSGLMELPVDPAVGGWYRFGPDPAADKGNVLISAHVDAPGFPIGPFSRIRDLGAGDVVDVVDAEGVTHTYAIQSVTFYPKSSLPVDEIFARDGSPALVLVTCGGAFDASTGTYEDNVVAIATPVA
jgi:hypothetical protein